MPISFANIQKNSLYSRHTLAELWGYCSFNAIARGVITPSEDNKVVLFVTEEKPAGTVPYQDRLVGNILYWEGPNDHFAEDRMLKAEQTGDEIHLFYRVRHRSDFTYVGRLALTDKTLKSDAPSSFVFSVI